MPFYTLLILLYQCQFIMDRSSEELIVRILHDKERDSLHADLSMVRFDTPAHKFRKRRLSGTIGTDNNRCLPFS